MTRRAFTLVDLIVVVAIIGLLLAIASPAAKRALQASRTVECLTHLKQIGLSLQQYLDTDGKYIMPELHNRTDIAEDVPALDTVLPINEDETEVFSCPVDRDLYAKSGTSYLWNTTVNGQHVDELFSILAIKDFESATRVPIVSDKESFHPELPLTVNLLYADYHVESNKTQFDVYEDEVEDVDD